MAFLKILMRIKLKDRFRDCNRNICSYSINSFEHIVLFFFISDNESCIICAMGIVNCLKAWNNEEIEK